MGKRVNRFPDQAHVEVQAQRISAPFCRASAAQTFTATSNSRAAKPSDVNRVPRRFDCQRAIFSVSTRFVSSQLRASLWAAGAHRAKSAMAI